MLYVGWEYPAVTDGETHFGCLAPFLSSQCNFLLGYYLFMCFSSAILSFGSVAFGLILLLQTLLDFQRSKLFPNGFKALITSCFLVKKLRQGRAEKQGAHPGSTGLWLQVDTFSPSREELETFPKPHRGKRELEVLETSLGTPLVHRGSAALLTARSQYTMQYFKRICHISFADGPPRLQKGAQVCSCNQTL